MKHTNGILFGGISQSAKDHEVAVAIMLLFLFTVLTDVRLALLVYCSLVFNSSLNYSYRLISLDAYCVTSGKKVYSAYVE